MGDSAIGGSVVCERAEWQVAFDLLVAAQTDMLWWYRDVHEPGHRNGQLVALEPAYDRHCEAVHDARAHLMTIAAPDWKALLVKLQLHAWMSGVAGGDDIGAAAQLLCADVARLGSGPAGTLQLVSTSPHIGPNFTAVPRHA
jgi:hypothetical protein